MSDAEFKPHWFGKYELLRRIGSGGMAEVFLARTTRAEGFEKVVVVKRMLPRLARDSYFVKMFTEEARLAVKLQHANVVQIVSLESEESLPFIVMEYVHGRDLYNVIRTAKKLGITLPVDFGIYCLAEMLKGLHYAHTALDTDGEPLNLVHRDVTPSNVFIAFEGEVKLGDFGVAHSVGETKSSEARGKYAYMAPEILEGQPVDARADIFSAGVVLWETLAQRRLFASDSAGEILSQVLKREPEPPSTHNGQVPFELDVITIKALQKKPAERFQAAAEFEEALSEFLFEQRTRWTPRRVAEVMRQVFPDDCKPLLLPPPSVPSVMGALLESRASDETPAAMPEPVVMGDELDKTLAMVTGGGERTPTRPPGSWVHRETPWPESLESNVFEVEDAGLASYQAAQGSGVKETLQLFGAPGTPPEVMPFEAALRRLSMEPRAIQGVGAGGSWAMTREEFGRLTLWDALSGVAAPGVPAVGEGSLGQFSVTRLLYELTIRRMTGALALRQADGNSLRVLYIEEGYPLYVVSDRMQDGAPLLMLHQELLPPSTLYRCLVQVIGDRLPIDRALLAVVGQDNENSIERTFSAIVRERLYDAFWWRDGQYRVFPAAPSPVRVGTRLPPLLGILVRGVRRAVPSEELEGAIYGRGLRRIMISEERRGHIPWLRLKPEEQVVVDAIDNQSNLPQVLKRLNTTDSEAIRAALATLYVLSETQIITLV